MSPSWPERPRSQLGIGTGRIALPLAQRGMQVHGIDLPRAMVARLRAKPAETNRRQDRRLRDHHVDGTYSVADLVFNTIRNLTTQAAQVACFRNAAAHLAAGGLLRHRGMVPEFRDSDRRDRRVCP